MKTLYLCRHAKSSWADPGMSDFDRPLNDRGSRNAAFMAAAHRGRGDGPDLIVSSPAVRALTTARVFADTLDIPTSQFKEDERLYHASLITLLEVVNGLPSLADSVMIFGHNPGSSELLQYLTDGSSVVMPTCGLARIDLHVNEWSSVHKATGTLAWFDFPKRYEGQG